MAQCYCNNCKEVIPINCHIKKAVCECGSNDLITACSRWNDKCGWDYFNRSGRFLKFVPHIPYGEGHYEEVFIKQGKRIVKQLTLEL